MAIEEKHVPMTVRHQQRRLRAYERFSVNAYYKTNEVYKKAKDTEKAALESRLGNMITVKH